MSLFLQFMIMATYFSGMYLGGEKIGYTIIDMKPTESGYILKEIVFIRLGMMGTKRSMETSSVYELDREYRLKKFSFELESETQKISSNGEVKEQELIYSVKTGSRERGERIKLDGDVYVSQSIPFLVSTLRKNLLLSVFDPTIFAVNQVKVSIIKETGDSIKIETELLGAKSTTWVGKNGEILRSEEPMGVLMVKENKKKALEFGETSPEILTMFAIPAGMEVKNPRSVIYLKAIVKGRFKKTGKQELSGDTLTVKSIGPDEKLIPKSPPGSGCSRVKPRPVPEELKRYLEDTPLIQVEDRRIRNKSARIIKGTRNNWEKVKELVNWTSQNVEDFPSATIPSALDVLETLKGDCNEHSTLFCALSRAAGIPTDICVGLVCMNGYFYYHAWNKVWVGRWVEVDPTFNQIIADATHITLEEGGLKDWAKIMDLVGNIEIRVIEYR
ncbi:MAG: hypothetical protein COT45_03150 [bacterium (Candidatus Stahlbacteria) CG08_land_8_20_14_0_20_40_26]|nr:MAG: hypothetical protein COX49_08475 [bacterium (Candidatus Stahlbacteria) CG23_combo_of_CG06-09_8_20_14_all_40_9]PIS25089.1 MAG: hypothetical protein COT45_03150 [bacterium (Candidatus Stahlbacteria) CG08_land_8_20_14_0_20_40_26]